MKKSDFKTFDIVFLRNKIKYFYFNKHFIPINEVDHILALPAYNEDLTRMNFSESDYDIMRVIRWDDSCEVLHLSDFIDKILNDTKYFARFKTIFERKETLELTINDIAKKYNVSPNQIRIKK